MIFRKLKSLIETDNSSFADQPVEISDRCYLTWRSEFWQNWDATGAGTLEYTVTNQGGVRRFERLGYQSGAESSEQPRDDKMYLLFYEQANVILLPGQSVTRMKTVRATFNLMESQDGEAVEPGTYYLSLWIDDESLEPEDNLPTTCRSVPASASTKPGSPVSLLSPIQNAVCFRHRCISSRLSTGKRLPM